MGPKKAPTEGTATKTPASTKKPVKKEITFIEELNKYEALCILEENRPTIEILDECDFVRPTRKKNVPAPEFDSEILQMKAYQNFPDLHNVILYDKMAEFLLRNKIFECALAQFHYVIGSEDETDDYFREFNPNYDELIDNSSLYKIIQVYHYIIERGKNEEEET